MRRFEQDVFPRVYARNRSRLMRFIRRHFARSRRPFHVDERGRRVYSEQHSMGAVHLPALRWWNCLVGRGGFGIAADVPESELAPVTERPGRVDIETEIDAFQRVAPPCPFFERLYADALARHIARARGAP
jgi:hypothetical protein